MSPERWRNVGSFCAAPPSTEARSSGNRTANHSAVFVPQLFRAIDKLAVGESHEVRTYTISTSFRLRAVCDAKKTEKWRWFSGQDVGMSDRARALRHSPPGQGCAP
ncbi:hypothetical protein, partial [Escherichia coli]|uniref:hypothetical protein n=3 Tax=Escherichia coli TaxID=562 RepID=UPI001BC8A0E5